MDFVQAKIAAEKALKDVERAQVNLREAVRVLEKAKAVEREYSHIFVQHREQKKSGE